VTKLLLKKAGQVLIPGAMEKPSTVRKQGKKSSNDRTSRETLCRPYGKRRKARVGDPMEVLKRSAGERPSEMSRHEGSSAAGTHHEHVNPYGKCVFPLEQVRSVKACDRCVVGTTRTLLPSIACQGKVATSTSRRHQLAVRLPDQGTGLVIAPEVSGHRAPIAEAGI
jgi:hypothetical protein